MNKSAPKPKNQPQRQRFIETAKELGCDESEEAFDATLRRIAKVPALAKTENKPG